MTSLIDGVLRALLEAGDTPLSGEKLATDLGVTRAAVWKSVKALKDEGYEIESQHGLGYTILSGGGAVRAGEIAARLTTVTFGRELRHLEELDSTNSEASKWAESGAPEGAIVVADRQLSGRGRLGRVWHDSKGESLLFSIVLRPEVELIKAPLITYVAAIALAETLSRWIDEPRVEIKWPNDILIGGRKIAGILLESRIEAGRLDYVVLGIGVNIGSRLEGFPEELRETATALSLEAGDDTVGGLDLLCGLLETLEEVYRAFIDEGFGALLPRWRRWFRMAGEEVTVTGGAIKAIGKVVGLSQEGALLLDTPDGPLQINAGDVNRTTTK